MVPKLVLYIFFIDLFTNRLKVISYAPSQGYEMNVMIKDGKCQFLDNLYTWARRFHNGRSYSCNIAGTQKMTNELDDFTWLDWTSDEGEEVDSLEQFFNRKRI